jgi:glycosyltransferase involved in cell wall biosynthesis
LKHSISSVIITYNESKNIQKCIDSVFSFSDEIIIVDSFSEDDTKSICIKNDKVRFFERVFDNYINQKNYANKQAQGAYIFSIDADEVASAPLIQFLENFNPDFNTLYAFHRLNYIGNKAIQFGSWYPDVKIRLWKKEEANWYGKTPHEILKFDKHLKVEKIDFPILHYGYSSIDIVFKKSIFYAKLASNYISLEKSYLSIFLGMLFSPLIKFFKGFVIKRAFINGFIGIQIEYGIARETFYKYLYALLLKLKRISNRNIEN